MSSPRQTPTHSRAVRAASESGSDHDADRPDEEETRSSRTEIQDEARQQRESPRSKPEQDTTQLPEPGENAAPNRRREVPARREPPSRPEGRPDKQAPGSQQRPGRRRAPGAG
jgi:hypothetical protein